MTTTTEKQSSNVESTGGCCGARAVPAHRRVGLISTMSPDKTWAPEVLERVSKTHGVVKAALENMGFEVLDEGPLHRDYQEMNGAARKLRARGINALVLYVGTWTYSNCAASAALEAGVPVVIWADANPGTCGLVGAAIARGAMDEVGAHANLVCGLFDDPHTCGRVSKLLGAACAAKGLDGQVLGVGGGRSMGMMTGVTDPTVVRTQFGVEIDQFEQMEVIDRAEKIAEDRVEDFLGWMRSRFGGIVAKEEAVKKQIRLYLALTDFSKEKAYDFVAVKCLPELPGLYTSFCLAHAIMGDAQDHLGAKNRTMFSCEADINAALTMQLMLLLTGGPVLFADLTEFNLETGLLTTCNCGSHPTDFAASPKDVIWEREGVHEFQWKYGGCCPQAVARSGQATVARLSRSKGKYQMLITPVEVVEQPREILKQTVWERPHAFLRILADREKFLGAVRSNHLHLVYGDFIGELEETCAILGVEPVVVR